MKKTKIENISVIKLDFFLRQNKEDVRVVLNPGETSWCDESTTTKSMLLYEKKNLIKTYPQEEPTMIINDSEILENLHTTEDIGSVEVIEFLSNKAQPSMEDFNRIMDSLDAKFGIPEDSDKITKEEEKKKPEKTYKGKKQLCP